MPEVKKYSRFDSPEPESPEETEKDVDRTVEISTDNESDAEHATEGKQAFTSCSHIALARKPKLRTLSVLLRQQKLASCLRRDNPVCFLVNDENMLQVLSKNFEDLTEEEKGMVG